MRAGCEGACITVEAAEGSHHLVGKKRCTWPRSFQHLRSFPDRCRFDPQTGLLHATPNMNVVNLMLRLLGPCTEFWLCMRILLWQVAMCAAALAARQTLADWVKFN